jgi:DNA-binding NarL/FixJ family response regulator
MPSVRTRNWPRWDVSAGTDPAGAGLCDHRPVATRVFIVDDHQPFRAAARLALERAGFDVVGEAADGGSALTGITRVRPELVLLDVNLPDLDGFDVAARLAGLGCPSAIVFVSAGDGPAQRRRVAASPALGFLPKSEFSVTALTELIG